MERRWPRAQRERGRAVQPRFATEEVLGAWLGAGRAITTLGLVSTWSHEPLLVAPFGASTVVLCGPLQSPQAQPGTILLGNTLAAGVRVASVAAFGTVPWVMGQAVALLGVLPRARSLVVLLPDLAGSLLLPGLAAVFNRRKGDAKPAPHHWL